MEVAGGDDHHPVARRILKPECRFKSGLLNFKFQTRGNHGANDG
jgi:hypothetical protein